MSRHRKYHGLDNVKIVKHLSYFNGCFISVHDWHIAIHENERIVAVSTFVEGNIFFDLGDSTLARHGDVDNFLVHFAN